MRVRKTPVAKRTVYKQYDDEGKQIYTFDPERDEVKVMNTLSGKEMTIAEKKAMVKSMHAIDDAEVRVYIKEHRLSPDVEEKRKKEVEKYISDFKNKYGYEPHKDEIPISLHREYVPYNVFTDEEEADVISEVEKTVVVPVGEEKTAVQCMRRLVKGFTQRQQEVYHLVGCKGMTNRQAAAQLGISEVRVGQIMQDIIKKLRQSTELRKYFRNIEFN